MSYRQPTKRSNIPPDPNSSLYEQSQALSCSHRLLGVEIETGHKHFWAEPTSPVPQNTYYYLSALQFEDGRAFEGHDEQQTEVLSDSTFGVASLKSQRILPPQFVVQ